MCKMNSWLRFLSSLFSGSKNEVLHRGFISVIRQIFPTPRKAPSHPLMGSVLCVQNKGETEMEKELSRTQSIKKNKIIKCFKINKQEVR